MPLSHPDCEDLRRVIFAPMLSVFSAIFDRAQNAERPLRHAAAPCQTIGISGVADA